MTRYGMLIDAGTCAGCDACVMACKYQNATPSGMYWCKVIKGEYGTYPNSGQTVLPMACMHCQDAPCVNACPTGASYHDENGCVQVDYDKCIGCRMCMAACPYNARVFNWNEPVRDPDFNYGDKDVPVRPKGVVEKCTLCKERTDRGDEPMCVVCCPTKARIYGDLDDPDSEVSRAIRERGGYVLLEEQGTRPQVHYFD